MCGISGYISFRDDLPLEDYYARHLLLRHRGRDDEGFFTLCERGAALHRGDDTIPELHDLSHIRDQPSARVVLGHRRLAILDLSAHGHQPMSRENGRYVMIYNGEIYNYVELRSELISLGHSFESTSDTEVLLAAYAQWGIDCFSRLNGMWAVAIYDGEEDTLVLSRDRFGIKPLYYATVDATLYFASEVKFLLPYLPAVRMNEHRVKEYLVECLVDHHEQTLFEGVHQVLPATWMRVRKGGIERYTYWRVPRDRRAGGVSGTG